MASLVADQAEPEQVDNLEDVIDASPSAAAGGGDGSETNDSWTLLDDDDCDDAEVASVQDVGNGGNDIVAKARVALRASKVAAAGRGSYSSSSSDIETIDELPAPSVSAPGVCLASATDKNLDSLASTVSDGIPVKDDVNDIMVRDMDEDFPYPQWVWSNEGDLLDSRHFSSALGQAVCDEDDLDDGSVNKEELGKDDNLSTAYPSEELPDSFMTIIKGHTYSHQPNRRLNMTLSSVLVLVVAMTLGLGIGHFLGTSEVDTVDSNIANLQCSSGSTDNLLNPPLGNDQASSKTRLEKELQALALENEELKRELTSLLTDYQSIRNNNDNLDMDDAIKDRINSLLLDNADLEQEVARLRYSRAAVAVEEDTETSRNDLERSRTSLLEAKRSLNDVSNENAQLRLEIGKAKYGKFRNKHDVVDGEEAEEGYGWNDESRNLLDAKPANDLKDWDNSEEQPIFQKVDQSHLDSSCLKDAKAVGEFGSRLRVPPVPIEVQERMGGSGDDRRENQDIGLKSDKATAKVIELVDDKGIVSGKAAESIEHPLSTVFAEIPRSDGRVEEDCFPGQAKGRVSPEEHPEQGNRWSKLIEKIHHGLDVGVEKLLLLEDKLASSPMGLKALDKLDRLKNLVQGEAKRAKKRLLQDAKGAAAVAVSTLQNSLASSSGGICSEVRSLMDLAGQGLDRVSHYYVEKHAEKGAIMAMTGEDVQEEHASLQEGLVENNKSSCSRDYGNDLSEVVDENDDIRPSGNDRKLSVKTQLLAIFSEPEGGSQVEPKDSVSPEARDERGGHSEDGHETDSRYDHSRAVDERHQDAIVKKSKKVKKIKRDRKTERDRGKKNKLKRRIYFDDDDDDDDDSDEDHHERDDDDNDDDDDGDQFNRRRHDKPWKTVKSSSSPSAFKRLETGAANSRNYDRNRESDDRRHRRNRPSI